ncbi:MAG: S8 family serine peptidase [bacterium]|nr:S8 family serine peptidase [bacterium]
MFQPRFLRLFALCLLLLIATFSAAANQPVTSERLSAAMGANDFSWRNSDGSLTVWVFFQDKGFSGLELEAALDLAEDNLTERAAWRRGKVTAAGERLVNVGDLPVHPSYLEAVKNTGAIFRRESRWLNAASFQMTDSQINQMLNLNFVRKTDLVARFQHRPIPSSEPVIEDSSNDADKNSDKSPNWTIDYGGNLAAMVQAGVPAVHEMGIDGSGVIVGMLDSGFHFTHEALINTPVLGTYDFVNDDENVDNEPGDPGNSRDHGTMTMSTVTGNMPGELVAPAFGASVVLAKTEDVSQEIPIEEDQWVAGLEWVETFGVDIVSSSLGYLDWYDFSDMDGNTAVTTLAADLAVARGIIVINSAGNERNSSWNHIIAPADGFDVITVGAVDSSDNISSFSSPGPSYDGRIKPDVSALGVSNTVADPSDDNGYRTASGTSFSCPLTSGVAALILSRAPNLTPAQVREALRETASMADSPNNDFGWGIINAFEAVQYFGPNLDHAPLGDSESTGTPYSVSALVTDREGLDTVTLSYRIDSGLWQQQAMTATGEPDTYSADIPGQAAGTTVDYYLSALSTNGVQTVLPALAPENYFSFNVGPDVTLPELLHNALSDQALIAWPPTLYCTASDNLGLDRVEMTYQLNGGPVMGPYVLTDDSNDAYSLVFPVDAVALQVGDSLTYSITAYDLANIPNENTSGPHAFIIMDALGVVLVLDDTAAARADEKTNKNKQPVEGRNDGKSSAATIATWLTDAGYVADVMIADQATLEDFLSYQLVILSAGDNAVPVDKETTRQALQDWATSGGKLLIEGGEIGYDALSNPGYPDFAQHVLHGESWDSDNSGDLHVDQGYENHPLLNVPVMIDPTVTMTYDGYGDQDAVEATSDAYVIMSPAAMSGDAGILVHDNNSAPQSAQIVYFAFNVEAIDGTAGKDLTLNAAAYLLAAEPAPTSSISGTVNLVGEMDNSGVLVSNGAGASTLTEYDGSYTLDNLYEGLYSLQFSKAEWGTIIVDVDLDDGTNMTGINVNLMPVIQVEYSTSPNLPIPDNSSNGISSTIVVPENEAGIISDVTVDIDIEHTYIGDLSVQLISPTGQIVNLHDRSGGSANDIIGNWPMTLTVDGPGSLNDYIGISNSGTWVLAIADHAGSDTGTLVSWGINFTIPGTVSGVDGEALPAVTRLNPNVPNPFNPMTKISFDLAHNGSVRLGIFNLRGHLVRHLISEEMVAGRHTVRWDGRDDGGRSVSSGVYLYRLESGADIQERKMLLVR